MRQDKYWASKVPLFLALLFLLNIFLVIAGELLFFYRYPAQPDAAALARYDSVYTCSTIVSSDSISGLTASLVETSDGEIHLVVTRKHNVVLGRGKIIYAEPVEVPENGELTVPVKNGLHTAEIDIANTAGETSVTIHYGYSGSYRSLTTYYMLIAAALEALELVVWELIKRNLR